LTSPPHVLRLVTALWGVTFVFEAAPRVAGDDAYLVFAGREQRRPFGCLLTANIGVAIACDEDR